PAATIEQVEERTLVERRGPTASDAPEGAAEAFEATQVSALPERTAAPAPPAARPPAQDRPGRASFSVAPEFDSIAALHRLATGAASAEPPLPPLPVESVTAPPRWAWPAAFAIAVLAALLIAFA